MNEQVNEWSNDCHKEKVNTFQKQNVGSTRFLMAFVSLVHFFISKGIYCPIHWCICIFKERDSTGSHSTSQKWFFGTFYFYVSYPSYPYQFLRVLKFKPQLYVSQLKQNWQIKFDIPCEYKLSKFQRG